MGATKNHIYTQDQIEQARLFKALGHPARIAIIENLLEHDDLNCKGLGAYIQLAQSTISKHIKELFDAGILSVGVVANNAFYKPYKIAFEKMIDYLDQIIQKTRLVNFEELNVYVRPTPYISLQRFFNTT